MQHNPKCDQEYIQTTEEIETPQSGVKTKMCQNNSTSVRTRYKKNKAEVSNAGMFDNDRNQDVSDLKRGKNGVLFLYIWYQWSEEGLSPLSNKASLQLLTVSLQV